jgi:hypothetical protein
MAVLQLMFAYLAVMNDLFHTTPLGIESWLRFLGSAVIANLVVAFEIWLPPRSEEDRNQFMSLPELAGQLD